MKLQVSIILVSLSTILIFVFYNIEKRSKTVKIEDLEFKNCIKMELNIDKDRDFKLKDLESIIDLNCSVEKLKNSNNGTVDMSNEKINSIKGVKYLKNLAKLDLSDHNIEDISELKNLKNLENLIIKNNKIKDISVLKNIPSLKKVTIYGNLIKDFKNMEKIEFIGSLTKKEIQKGIKTKINQIKKCYEDIIVLKPSFKGSIIAEFIINSRGSVDKIILKTEDMSDKNFTQCIKKAIKTIKFTPPYGVVKVKYPFKFSN